MNSLNPIVCRTPFVYSFGDDGFADGLISRIFIQPATRDVRDYIPNISVNNMVGRMNSMTIQKSIRIRGYQRKDNANYNSMIYGK